MENLRKSGENAAAMKKAVSECLNKRNHFCVEDCIEKERPDLQEKRPHHSEILQLIAKCRALVSHFKYSTKSTYSLLN